ncbi:MAG: DNA polymerase IV [Candidatus Liptonbacteria bacterium]|nr:DNA polymerase IV [Candidatus Liptonbacteria bacterium]
MRIIAHLDMDAFFAAVEERERPRLRGRPIIIGADPEEGQGRGVVSTASYKARAYGIHSAMPISKAWQLAETARRAGQPEAVWLEPDFKKYSATSDRIMATVRQHAQEFEQASIDEAYLDLSPAGSFKKAIEICRDIKKEIKRKEKLTCSIGLGPNKLIAKIASDREKPDGLTVVESETVESFLSPLSIRVIPGIGPKTEKILNQLRIQTVQDALCLTEKELDELLGKWGIELYRKVRGQDDSPISHGEEAKSIGEQETFPKDTRDPSVLLEHLQTLCRNVFRRLGQDGFEGFRRVVVTVRFAGFDTKNRSATLPVPARTCEALEFEAAKLILPFFDRRENPGRKAIRLIGVRVELLDRLVGEFR